jgi:hypothetical protein
LLIFERIQFDLAEAAAPACQCGLPARTEKIAAVLILTLSNPAHDHRRSHGND